MGRGGHVFRCTTPCVSPRLPRKRSALNGEGWARWPPEQKPPQHLCREGRVGTQTRGRGSLIDGHCWAPREQRGRPGDGWRRPARSGRTGRRGHRPGRLRTRQSGHAALSAVQPPRAAATVSGAGGLRGHRLWKGRQTFKPGSRGASPQGFGQGPPCIPGGAPVPPVGRVPPGQPRIRAALATCGWRAGFPPAPGRPLPVPAETSVCSQEQGPPHGCPAQEEPQSGAPRLPGCPPLPSF